MTPDRIARLERISAEIFVPRATWEKDDWRALVSAIPNRRANAAYPFTAIIDPAVAIEEVADFFDRHDRPLLFKVTPATPDSVRSALQTAGLEGVYGADVLTRPLPGRGGPSARVEIDDQITDRWLSVFARDHPLDPAAVHEAYQAGGSQVGAAQVDDVAIGLGIVRDEWLGVFSMVTVPEARRRGLAGAILDTLMEWGAALGATSAYLQVVADNLPAQRLYTGRGFEFAYAYEYWMRPGAE